MTLVQSALHQSSKDPSSANNELLKHFTAAFQQAQQDLGFKVTSSITTLTAGLNKTLNAIQQTQRELHTSVEDLELRVERKIDVIHKTQMDATNQILRRLDRLDNALEKQNSQINKVAQDKSESSSANEAILRERRPPSLAKHTLSKVDSSFVFRECFQNLILLPNSGRLPTVQLHNRSRSRGRNT
ncbi:hypothetical protein T439DRAFT_238639 [Meredithblackwellia eburnea MCA 4105]